MEPKYIQLPLLQVVTENQPLGLDDRSDGQFNSRVDHHRIDERLQTISLGGQFRPALTKRARGAPDIFRHLLNSTNVNFCTLEFVDIVSEVIDFLCGLRDGVDDNVDYGACKKSTMSVFASDESYI